MVLNVTKKAREFFIQNGYDPNFGARPMRRLIQNEIEEKLAVLILQGRTKKDKKITVDLERNKITVKFEGEKKAKKKQNAAVEAVAQTQKN